MARPKRAAATRAKESISDDANARKKPRSKKQAAAVKAAKEETTTTEVAVAKVDAPVEAEASAQAKEQQQEEAVVFYQDNVDDDLSLASGVASKQRRGSLKQPDDESGRMPKRRSVTLHPDTNLEIKDSRQGGVPRLTASLLDTPGFGWSNGDIKGSVLYPYSREGKVKLYGHERRWINATSSWTRIGTGSEFDSVHSDSKSGERLVKDNEEEARTVKSLIAQLCENFYNKGWATGTGGGCSIRVGGPDEDRPWRVFVAPSGLQKEDMIGEDIFELDMEQNVVEAPATPNLRQSACTPLWYVVYKYRPNAKCVIHTHSINAQMATLLDPTEKSSVLKITHLEMLKGVGNHAYDDVLEVPIIDNRPSEDLLAAQLESIIQQYPKTNAVLVRRHGIYVWGDSWEQAKCQAESFDYLFESAIKMKSMLQMDPGAIPQSGTYRVTGEATTPEKSSADAVAAAAEADTSLTAVSAPPAVMNGHHHKSKKTAKTAPPAPSAIHKQSSFRGTGFNNMTKSNNSDDLQLGPKTIPLVPRHSQILLLDIEGCTTSISSVKDGLFPYIAKHIGDYVKKLSTSDIQDIYNGLQEDITGIADASVLVECQGALMGNSGGENANGTSAAAASSSDDKLRQGIVECVRKMVEHDVKATALKKLQGEMWDYGYQNGELKGHVYEDVLSLFKWCKSQGVQVNIYSSGSVHAQKLLFKHSIEGDLIKYLTHHFDTKNAGNKKQSKSYDQIAKLLNVEPSEITFVSDAEAELVAAREAKFGHVVMSVRPGNVPLTDVGNEFPIVHSLLQLCGV